MEPPTVSATSTVDAARDRDRRTVELLSRSKNPSLSDVDRHRCIQLAVELNLPIADGVARQFQCRNADPDRADDLRQVARQALFQAASRFDPASGAFLSFAVPTISAAIKQHLRDCCWTVRYRGDE